MYRNWTIRTRVERASNWLSSFYEIGTLFRPGWAINHIHHHAQKLSQNRGKVPSKESNVQPDQPYWTGTWHPLLSLHYDVCEGPIQL
jgi:hypothetical protein